MKSKSHHPTVTTATSTRTIAVGFAALTVAALLPGSVLAQNGGIQGPTTARPGDVVDVWVSNGSTSLSVYRPGHIESVAVPIDGRVRIRIPADVPIGTSILITTTVPDSQLLIEVTQDG